MKRIVFLAAFAAICVFAPVHGQIPLTTLGSPYTQNFDTLANTGTSATNVPSGWAFVEAGTNANTTYAAGNGGSSTGNTYSFGSDGSTERAFGGLLSGSLIPIFGAQFSNNTGQNMTSLTIGYVGEEWRLGNNQRGPDRIDFQYSTDATSLTTGSWTDVDELDFLTPNLTGLGGVRNGNLPENRTSIAHAITGLNIPSGTTFWIRWTDFDAMNSDDGLGVDDFSLTALAPSAAPVSVSGRVRTKHGMPIRNALVVISGGDLTEPVTVATGAFGTFSFAGLRAGQTYVVTVSAGRHTFTEPVRTVVPVDNVDDLDFVAN